MIDRLQKKCLIASAGTHLLLVVILFVGPAFLSPKSKPEEVPVINFIPSKFIDQPFAGGGNPNAKPPPAIQPPSPPPQQREPVTAREPDPPKITQHKLDPDSFEDKPEPKRHTPQVSITPVTRRPKSNTKITEKKTDSQSQERQLAEQRRRLANELTSAARSIGESTSSATEVGDFGPGGGGPAYASYAAYIQSVYDHAWEPPEDSATDNAITKVSVTIERDGTVLTSRIVRHSGDTQADRSVQRALDKVGKVEPFPEGVKDRQRTYIINFNLKAKRGLA